MAIRSGTRSKRSTPARPGSTDASGGGRASSLSTPGTPRVSQGASSTPPMSLARITSFDSMSRKTGSTTSVFEFGRGSPEPSRMAGVSGGVGRIASDKGIRSGQASGSGSGSHERSGSALSANSRSILGAFNDSFDRKEPESRPQQETADEFDALVASGETMKVSLTPSRLKTFEVS